MAMNPQFFETTAELRRWLNENHAAENELWLGIYKKESGIPSVSWVEAVDEAMCFGWTESRMKRLDMRSYCIRLSPRKAKSQWSQKNIAKAKLLIDLGLMEPAAFEPLSKELSDRSKIA